MSARKERCALLYKCFGFSSLRKYGFLHSSWEVIIARRTGTTHSILDYVVYRLFYVLTLTGVSVYLLSQVNPLPFLLYFETWSLLVHTVYAILFLRQVLTHNVHRKKLGRKEKKPDQLIVTDEIERGGHKYFISKKISVLPRGVLSAYEKLVWIMFSISSTLGILCFVISEKGINILQRFHVQGTAQSSYNPNLILMLGTFSSLIDIVVTTVPMRVGHCIYSGLFCLIYFGIAYWYDSTSKAHLYNPDVWNSPTNIYILLLVVPCHISVCLLAFLRDFIISYLDQSRTAVNRQKVRTQKRLARRKIMVPIYGPDGRVHRIALEHGSNKGAADEYIVWKEGRHDVEKAAGIGAMSSVSSTETIVATTNELSGLVQTLEEEATKYSPLYFGSNAPSPGGVLATMDSKPKVHKVTSRGGVQFPSAPSNRDLKGKDRLRKLLPVLRIVMGKGPRTWSGTDINMKSLSPASDEMGTAHGHRDKPRIMKPILINSTANIGLRNVQPRTDLLAKKDPLDMDWPHIYQKALLAAYKREFNSQYVGVRDKPPFNTTVLQNMLRREERPEDADMEAEKKKYFFLHQEHDIESRKEIPPSFKPVVVSRGKKGNKPTEVKDKEPQDPVYNALATPRIPNVTTTYHYLETPIVYDEDVGEGKILWTMLRDFESHPGIPILHPLPPQEEDGIEEEPAPPNPPSEEIKPIIKGKKGKKSLDKPTIRMGVVTFHPVVQAFQYPSRSKAMSLHLLAHMMVHPHHHHEV